MFKKFSIAFAILFALILTGCSTPSTTPSSDASVATPAPSASPKEKNTLKAFGGVNTWDNGVSISVSEPVPFEATRNAAGVVEGQAHVIYTLVLTNGTDKVLEGMSLYETVSSGGVEAHAISDSGHSLGSIGFAPTTSVLPGQTIKWMVAYNLADPKSVTFEISPGFEYKKAIFTNIFK